MREVFVVATTDDAGGMQINGVFTTREGAKAICRGSRDAVVTFPVDVDCTDERTFEVEIPTTGAPPSMVTA